MEMDVLLQNISNIMDQKLEEKLEKVLDKKFKEIDCKFEAMDKKLGAMDKKLGTMDVELKTMDVELKKIPEKVTYNFSLALDAWGTSMENRKWLQGIQEKLPQSVSNA